jgi:DNA-binding response OmpR family regulator
MEPIHVLLVEDSPGDVLLTQQALANCSVPVRLHFARDGEHALILLSDPEFQPSLIILDLNLPRISGFRLLDRYRRKDVPVLVFSVCSRELDRQVAMALGACDYVRKPTDLQAYADAVCVMVEKWVVQEEALPRFPKQRRPMTLTDSLSGRLLSQGNLAVTPR